MGKSNVLNLFFTACMVALFSSCTWNSDYTVEYYEIDFQQKFEVEANDFQLTITSLHRTPEHIILTGLIEGHTISDEPYTLDIRCLSILIDEYNFISPSVALEKLFEPNTPFSEANDFQVKIYYRIPRRLIHWSEDNDYNPKDVELSYNLGCF